MSTTRSPGEAPTSGRGRVWIVDPLDGTINYANGIPFFCVSIGLVVDGRPTVGVIHDPTRHETFAATVDGPGHAGHGPPIHASDKDKLSDFVISMALNGRDGRARARTRSARRSASRGTMGSAALALAYVANGRFDAFSSRVASRPGTSRRPGSSPSAAARGSPRWTAARGSTSRSRRSRSAIFAAPPAHHQALLELVR